MFAFDQVKNKFVNMGARSAKFANFLELDS